VGVKRKQHSADFKARVAMAALSGEKTLVDDPRERCARLRPCRRRALRPAPISPSRLTTPRFWAVSSRLAGCTLDEVYRATGTGKGGGLTTTRTELIQAAKQSSGWGPPHPAMPNR
jgi:hypothetical protein